MPSSWYSGLRRWLYTGRVPNTTGKLTCTSGRLNTLWAAVGRLTLADSYASVRLSLA